MCYTRAIDKLALVEQSHTARNKQKAAWRQFITLLEFKANLGCHVRQAGPEGTTKERTSCGVETAKPIWVREHSCPWCGFECDRDANVTMNVLQRGFQELGLDNPKMRLWRLRSYGHLFDVCKARLRAGSP